MRILKVSLKNLNSIKGEYVIDFTRPPLSESGLFAITGETGAGKSTILDAISLAIYQSIPRGSSEDDIMSYGTSEAYAEVEFAVHDKIYRSSWTRHRARKRADGDLQNSECRLADITNPENPVYIAEKKTDIKTKIVEITGLDVDKFTQSVLLAQGQFAAFMKAKPKERGELLEKITQQKNYSIFSRGAFEKHKIELKKYEDLKLLLGKAKVLTADERQDIEIQKIDLANEMKSQNIKIKKIESEIRWLKQLKEKQQENNNALLELKNAQKLNAEFLAGREKLEWHEKTIPLQGKLSLWTKTSENITSIKARIEEFEKNIPLLSDKYSNSEKDVQSIENEIKLLDEKYNLLSADFDKANELDEHIRQQISLNARAFENKKVLVEKIQNLEKEYLICENRLLENQNQLNIINEWIEKSSHYESLSELKGNLLVQLPELEKLNEDYVAKQKVFDDYKKQLPGLETKFQELKGLEQNFQELHEKFSKEILEKRDELDGVFAGKSIHDLREESRSASEKVLIINVLCSFSEKYNELNENLTEKTLLFNKNRELFKNLSEQKLDIEGKIITQEKLLDALEVSQKLELMVKNYESDREKLKVGKPCFLCGSIHHPYIENSYVSNVSEIENQLKIEKQSLHALKNTLNQINIDLPKEKDLSELEVRIEKQTDLLKKIISDFNTEISKVGVVNLKVDEHEKLSKFKAKYIENARLIDLKIANSDTLNENIKILNNQLSDLSQKQSENLLEKSKFEIERRRIENLRIEAEKETLLLQNGWNERKQKVEKLLLSFGLVLSVNQSDTINSVSEKIKEFELNSKKKNEISDQIKQDTVVISLLKKQLDAFKQNDLASIEKEILELGNRLKESQNHRKTILNGRSVKEIVREFEQNNINFKKTLDSAKSNFETINSELKLEISREKDARLSLKEMEEEMKKITKILMDSILGIFDSLDDVFAKRLSEEQYSSLKVHSEGLKRQENVCKVKFQTISEQLQKLIHEMLTEESMEALLEQTEVIKFQYEDFLRKHNYLNSILLQDEEVRKSQLEILQNIEAQQRELARWEKLKDLIGSADGDKFRKYAQSITMRVLAVKANQHLARISGRYEVFLTHDMKRLQELNFDIVDMYQGDHIRPMNTLSGGETFLVSLALALGLSDMASGSNPVESLFVDEGFGALDPQTLEMALSALENLQSTGKTIGIISHVELLKERIPCQIQLIKKGAGVSEIVVK